ncbi:MAG TPA: HEPN domain-containing protein [Chloroflexia bacterium]|jgi:uncharacterized protein (UPF0332 family)|nr:HEPN domain-containing protein [Chloroflexia bacterium]
MALPTWLDKAERYLESATLLHAAGDYDSCVSRAYYAARYLCLYLLEQEGLNVDRHWQHGTIVGTTIARARNKRWLRRITMAGRADFAQSLNYLLELRGAADYGRNEVTARQAQRALAFAEALRQAVKENYP